MEAQDTLSYQGLEARAYQLVGIGTGYASFKDFSLGFSWYLANTFNQTFDPKVSVSSGYSKIYLQTGYVRNSGVELSLGYGHTWNNHLHWESNFTLSHNKNTIKDLVTSYIHPETGLPITQNRLDVGGLGKARFILKKGVRWVIFTHRVT